MTNELIKQERARLEGKYRTSRYNLLLVIIFTVINIVLLVTQSNTYFLFSASVPYFIADIGMLFAGMYPEEFYFETGIQPMLDITGFVFVLSIAIVILLAYLLCFIKSKNRKVGWLIAALVFISADTAMCLVLYGLEGVIDIVFHGWVIFDLACGIKAHNALNKLPEPVPEEEPAAEQSADDAEADSEPLYPADMGAKARVRVQANALGHEVVYRRVKRRINELVIDGKVYDYVEMISEPAHNLSAKIGSHQIEAGFNGLFTCYIKLDGETIAKKNGLF
jgi:hypothetical protein